MQHQAFFIGLIALLGISACAARPRGRILGGRETTPHLKPYMASLQVHGKHICGGFLIAEQWVMSAAHCLEDMDNATFHVLLGAHSLKEHEPHKHLYGVHRHIVHPGSNHDTNHDDLLLIQLEERAHLNQDVQVLAFQRVDQDVPAGTKCEVAGWGITSNTGRHPDKLQAVELPIISREVCNRRIHHDNEITEKMLCADSRKKDSCKGDSGGPLVCHGVAEGVVTSGSRVCGNWKKPGIYTRISAYVGWIDSILASTH